MPPSCKSPSLIMSSTPSTDVGCIILSLDASEVGIHFSSFSSVTMTICPESACLTMAPMGRSNSPLPPSSYQTWSPYKQERYTSAKLLIKDQDPASSLTFDTTTMVGPQPTPRRFRTRAQNFLSVARRGGKVRLLAPVGRVKKEGGQSVTEKGRGRKRKRVKVRGEGKGEEGWHR